MKPLLLALACALSLPLVSCDRESTNLAERQEAARQEARKRREIAKQRFVISEMEKGIEELREIINTETIPAQRLRAETVMAEGMRIKKAAELKLADLK